MIFSKNWEDSMMINSNVKNEMKPKLSVVVIAFNNELYIEEALESLDEQTFDDMEVVVVNDYSSDRTGELIDNFIADKTKFKAIHLHENSGGCSTPRNTGIAHTTGEYIMFLDGDDWYTIDACEKMVAAIERTDSDFVAGQVIRTNNYEIWYHKQIYNREHTDINIREFPILLFDSLSVNKIYKRSFLDKHSLRFPEGIHYEDIVFTGNAYFLAESVSIIPEPIYYWRVVENADVKSITNRRFDFDNFRNRITAHRYFDEFMRKNGFTLYQDHKNNKFLRHDLKLYTNDYLLFDEEYKQKFHKLIHEYLHEAMDEYAFIKLPERERILYYLLYIGDRAAFDDYISYINGMPTSEGRIYAIGDSYYFRSSDKTTRQQKFLIIGQPHITFKISNLELTNEQLTFTCDIGVPSLTNSELTYSWILKNRHTGHVITSSQTGYKDFSIPLRDVEPGNYYLSLAVGHYGNIHKQIVKLDSIESLPNIKVSNKNYSKATFINHKNSFAIKVQPLRKFDQVRWIFGKRLNNPQVIRKMSPLKNAYERFMKNMIGRLPVKQNWVFLESHMGKQYSDSPKYIYEELYKTENRFKYIWSFTNPDVITVPGPAIKVERNSLSHYYYMARSKYWIDNQGIAHLAKKTKEHTYVQTWHGTPLKRMGYDQRTIPSDNEIARLKLQTKSWDYFVSPNPYSTTIFRRAFRYGGNILETGYPRNDILITKPSNVIEKVNKNLNIPHGKKIVLFAPTFRDWDPNSFQNTLKDIRKLSKEIDDKTVVLLRLHYLLSNMLSSQDLPENIINASTYDDISELYLISDILITDYSSVMFDYALLKRPIILYCYDLDEYVTRRGTYFDLEKKAPGPVCESLEEVIQFLNNPSHLCEFKTALDAFSSEFGSLEDGQAARKVIDNVFKK
jgi:CDP-glycerol glycerophosphotransferase